MKYRLLGGLFYSVIGIILLMVPFQAFCAADGWSGINYPLNNESEPSCNSEWTYCGIKLLSSSSNDKYLLSVDAIDDPGEHKLGPGVDLVYVNVSLSSIKMDSRPEDISYYCERMGARLLLDKIPLQPGAPDYIKSEEIPLARVTRPISIMDYRIYEFSVSLPGYETIVDRIVVTPGEVRKVSYSMVPRLDRKGDALWRSLALPGWGQRYNGHNLRGWVMTAAQIASIAFSAYAYYDYGIKKDDYNDAVDDYNNAVSADDVRTKRLSAQKAEDELHDAGYLADYSLIIVGGVYSINLLDISFLGGGKIRVGSGVMSVH